MKVDKENEFNSFSKLLTRLDTGNLGDYELKLLKQEHDYLDRLRNQRIKIEELKQKYDYAQIQLNEQMARNDQLVGLVEEKTQLIEQLENQLESETKKRQAVEKALQKHVEIDKGKIKNRMKQLEGQNQSLRNTLRQKQLAMIAMEQQFNDKLKKYKESYQVQRRNLLIQLEQKLNEARSKNSDNQLIELRTLVSRQNKALKMQNQKFEQLSEANDALSLQFEELKAALERKQAECEAYESKVGQLYEEMELMQSKMQKQDHNNKLKGQLDDIRRKMAQMQKGEIERIQFIVNEFE